MSRLAPHFARLALAASAALAATLAHALTPAELQQLLQGGTRPDVRYEETRESPWLSSPVTTRGTLRVTAEALEKRVDTPRQETWRMLDDRVEWIGPGKAGRKQILFSQAPALRALADVTRRAVSGDLAALERDFRITVQGDERVWSAQLVPRGGAVSRLESVQLQGTGRQLRVLIVTERDGERTTTRLVP